MLDEALRYYQLGFSVIPIGQNKKPLIDWKRFQSERAQPEQIRSWFTQFPNANIAVATGAVSGIVVIDIEREGSPAGYPATVSSRTGGGGWHLYYKHPGIRIKNSVRDLAPFTDVRGDGGYVVLPPSLHASGERYEWSVLPWDGDFTELTDDLVAKLREGPTNPERTNWSTVPNTTINEGERNNMAAKVAGKILYDLEPGLWEMVGWTGLQTWNENNCRPPLPLRELRSVFESIAQMHSTSDGKKIRKEKEGSPGVAVTVCLADIQPEPIKWLWPGRIALGKLTMIAGDPGLGKSLFTITVAAIVTNGGTWPVDKTESPVGDVLILSAEDDPADTLRPRLDAAGANINRTHILKSITVLDENGKPSQRMFSLKKDIASIEKLLPTIPECRLLIIDPVTAYLDGVEGNSNSDIRGLFAPLAEVAARHNIAIVMVSHLNKSGGGKAIYRTMGSLAFTAAVRTAYVVTKDPEEAERRLVMPMKNNIAKDTTGIAYVVLEKNIPSMEGTVPYIEWEPDPVITTADEALSFQENKNEEKTETDWAVWFLEELLAGGPVPADRVYKEAKVNNISPKSVRRAQERLNIKPKKSSFSGGWVWAIPGREDTQQSEDAQPNNEGTFEKSGHLGSDITNNVVIQTTVSMNQAGEHAPAVQSDLF